MKGLNGGRVGSARETAIRIGVVNVDTWDFLRDLYALIAARSQSRVFAPGRPRAPIFKERFARYRFRRDMESFLASNDVVFFEFASELLARATRLRKRCAIVTRLHRYEMYRWVDQINWEAVDRVILVSEAKRETFVERFPKHASKTAVVPVGVSLSTFRFLPKPFSGSIGMLCHVAPRKRVYDLILALSDLLRRDRGLHFHVGGDPHAAHGDYHEALRHLVGRLGLEESVTFDGPVSQPAEWYAKIDVFISHSYSEGLQVAPMEAMATGCYTLSHTWAGADELVPGDCLYVTNPELEQKLTTFFARSDADKLRERHRMRSVAEERFDSSRSNERVFELLESTALGSRGSPFERSRRGG